MMRASSGRGGQKKHALAFCPRLRSAFTLSSSPECAKSAGYLPTSTRDLLGVLAKLLELSWRRGAGSNRRIKVLQTFIQNLQVVISDEFASSINRLPSDSAHPTKTYCACAHNRRR